MKDETILCIATRVWHSLWRSTQQYMSRMATQNRILFFEPGRNPDQPMVRELARNLPYFFAPHIQKVQENLAVIPTASSLPYARQYLPRSVLQITTPLIAKINAQMKIRQVRRAMQVLGVNAPILWLYEPSQLHLVGNFGEKLVCYFVYDEYPDFVHNRRIKELLRQYDDCLSSRADVVFASSRTQWERRKPLNPHTYFIPNGVNFDLFHKALEPATPLATDLASLKKPIIGYIGWLGYQIDVDLLVRVAETYHDCSLVLVGPDEIPTNASLHKLHSLPNVHFMGAREPSGLAQYLKGFDVALIPYCLAGYTLSAYPLKLHEYLAAGQAIVSTALPELRAYAHVVRIAETHDQFVQQICEALYDRSHQAVEARVAVARQNTWDQRVDEIYGVLEQNLPY